MQALREADNLPDDPAPEPADHVGPADHVEPADPLSGGEGDGEDLEDDLNGEELSDQQEESDCEDSPADNGGDGANGELPHGDSDSDASTMRLDDAREDKDNAPACSGAGLDTDGFIFEDPDAYTPTAENPWGSEGEEEAGLPNIPSSWRGPTPERMKPQRRPTQRSTSPPKGPRRVLVCQKALRKPRSPALPTLWTLVQNYWVGVGHLLTFTNVGV